MIRPRFEPRSEVAVRHFSDDDLTEDSAPAGPVEAWRVFTVDADGVLLAPWAMRFGTDVPTDAWRTTVAIASCVSSDHEAPADECYCGLRGVQDLDELLARITGPGTVAAIARVKLSGRMLPGCDIPDDDPPTTLRAERAEVLELHLAPPVTSRSGAVADRYPSVPVYIYAAADWPHGITDAWCGQRVGPVSASFPPDVRKAGEEAFLDDVKAVGFGMLDVNHPDAELVIKKMGRWMADALRGGVSDNDCASVLFYCEVEPTYGQVRAVLKSALDNLCPECHFMFADPGYHFGEPITLSGAINRTLTHLGKRVVAGAFARARGQ